MPVNNFKKLRVWLKAHEFTLEIYKVTSAFPKSEMYGISEQMRRACASIPANIAEGYGRSGDNELRRFLHIAMGSSNEMEYFLALARDLRYINPEMYASLDRQINEIKQMLFHFAARLKK